MSKKQKQPTFTIDFVGIDLKLTGVTVKEVDRPDGVSHWMSIDQKGPKWIMLTTPGYMIEPSAEEPQVIEFIRGGEYAHIKNAYDEQLPVTKFTVLNIDKASYNIDICEGGHRIQMMTGFMNPDEHKLVEKIIFTKEV